LCKETIHKCDESRDNQPIPIIPDSNYFPNIPTGTNKFGYHSNNILDFCGTANLVSSTIFDDYNDVEFKKLNNLTIMTYNIWGLFKKNH